MCKLLLVLVNENQINARRADVSPPIRQITDRPIYAELNLPTKCVNHLTMGIQRYEASHKMLRLCTSSKSLALPFKKHEKRKEVSEISQPIAQTSQSANLSNYPTQLPAEKRERA